MKLGDNGEVTDAKATREEAIQAQEGHCPLCDLTGQVVIYHKKYDGNPTIKVIDHNGEEREIRSRLVAHCRCEVGKWMRAQITDKALLKRIPPFTSVGTGILKNWTPLDPTLPDFIPGDEPDWKALRRLIVSAGSVVKKVYPQFEGSKASAYRDMSEPDHPLNDARSSRRAVVPNDPGKPIPQPVAADDSEPPF